MSLRVRFGACWIGLVLAAGLTGCIAPRPATQPAAPAGPEQSWSATQVHRSLEQAAADWTGVPYRLGGTGRSGIDCSALVQQVYADHFAIRLPRATNEQSRIGSRVDPAALQPGDIVFFRPENGVRHSGVYLSNGRFLHASSSSGVRISTLQTSYWAARWWQARRILPTLGAPPQSGSAPSSSPTTQRGW